MRNIFWREESNSRRRLDAASFEMVPGRIRDGVGDGGRTAREVLLASLPACLFWDEAWQGYYPLIARAHKDAIIRLGHIIKRPQGIMCSSCCLIALHIFTSGVSVWFMVTLLLKANGGVYLLKCALPMLSTPSFRVFCWIATFQTRTPNRPSHSCTVYVRQVRPGSTLVIEKKPKGGRI